MSMVNCVITSKNLKFRKFRKFRENSENSENKIYLQYIMIHIAESHAKFH